MVKGEKLIRKVSSLQILDSRSVPTLQTNVYISDSKIVGKASVPSGASTGKHEMKEKRDLTQKYHGKSVTKAQNIVEKNISKKLKQFSVFDQKKIDAELLQIDKTRDLSNIGSNSSLSVSLAVSRGAAACLDIPLYKYIGKLFGNKKFILPLTYSNIINGGMHASNNLDFQEYMVVPTTKIKKFAERTRAVSEIYYELKQLLEKKYGKNATNVGDEGGFAPSLKSNEEPLKLLEKATEKAGYSGRVFFALDVAATSFYNKKNDKYKVDGKNLSSEKLLDVYSKLIDNYDIKSIEDPFYEEDFDSFAMITEEYGKGRNPIQIVADDLTTTNVERLLLAISANAGNCLLLKPNQIGTLTGALDAARLSIDNKWGVMVSHRSGETTDTYISDLAVGLGCKQIKLGAPARGERTAKYNRLLEIEAGF